MKKNRTEKMLLEMKEKKIGQLLISDPVTIFYLTDYWIHPGERLLVLILSATGQKTLVVNKLFPITEDLGLEIVYIDDTDDGVGKVLEFVDTKQTIGIDKNWPSKFLLELLDKVPHAKLCNGSKVTDHVRAIKDEEELEFMREVSKDNDVAITRLKELIPLELDELEMTDRLAAIYKELGNSGFSFDPIIAYGPNGADPHHVTDQSTVKVGDSIILDIGGVKNAYCSDMTRTYFYKEVSDKSREVYETCLEANKRAIEMVKPGVRFCDIDAAARDYITEKGYGEYFTHRTGHFIGIECHETGDVSATNTAVCEPGMIFSVEPGIYIPGEVGVRIEDLIICTEDGYENLNHVSKELEIIG